MGNEMKNEEQKKAREEIINNELVEGAYYGYLKDVIKTIKLGADVNVQGRYDEGETALILAARNGHTKIVKKLIEAEADVNMPDIYGRPPLAFALLSRRFEVAKILIKNGAKISLKGKIGKKIIKRAQGQDPTEIMELLVAAGAKVDPESNDY